MTAFCSEKLFLREREGLGTVTRNDCYQGMKSMSASTIEERNDSSRDSDANSGIGDEIPSGFWRGLSNG